jgi:hypothetical protein
MEKDRMGWDGEEKEIDGIEIGIWYSWEWNNRLEWNRVWNRIINSSLVAILLCDLPTKPGCMVIK